MTSTQTLLIGIVLLPLLLAAFDKLRMDLAALIIAAVLGFLQFAGLGMLGPAGSPQQAIRSIAGFSQPTVITLICLFILTRGLEKAGITYWVTHKIMRVGGHSETRLIALFAGTTALFSLLMNNLAAGALVLPSAMETCRRTGIRPSKLLIPVAYGSLLGGSATYFTTANIAASDLLRIAHPPQPPLTFMDYFSTGSLILLAGIIYLAIVGRKLLPDRPPGMFGNFSNVSASEMENYFQLNERLWEMGVAADSPLAGQTLAESCLGEQYGLVVAGIWRGNHHIFAPEAEQILNAGDILLIVGREDRVSQLTAQNLILEPPVQISSIVRRGGVLLEVMLSPHSSALGKTLKEIDFRNRYGFTVVALRRTDRSYRTNVGDLPLTVGDALLLAGPVARIKTLQSNTDFFVLQSAPEEQSVDGRKAIFVLTIFLAAIAASSLGVPIYLAMLGGALVLLIARSVSVEEAYHSVEWQAVFLVAGMYAVSVAMVETGLAQTLGNGMIHLAEPFGALGLAAGAYLLTTLLTQGMGGQVAALVTGPVTISAAISMGANPQAIAVATAIGCSASFLTPMAHPVNILMIAPANYRFKDFFHVGWPLTVLCFLALLAGLKLFWGF
ncbi:MAG: SLC13 family permease [Anaerolineaceae bacterium]|nr:SLC13 family permease [Anaerolineaceae bacterium]